MMSSINDILVENLRSMQILHVRSVKRLVNTLKISVSVQSESDGLTGGTDIGAPLGTEFSILIIESPLELMEITCLSSKESRFLCSPLTGSIIENIPISVPHILAILMVSALVGIDSDSVSDSVSRVVTEVSVLESEP